MKELDQKSVNRHRRFWRFLDLPVRQILKSKFNYSFEEYDFSAIEGPIIVLINHACAWDPLMTGLAFKNKPLSFVASEHLLRVPVWGKLIDRYIDIIPHKKGSKTHRSSVDILKRTAAGLSVFICPEGEQTWDGVTMPIIPSTARLIKRSGATLVNFRLEGTYLSMPRWAKNTRKGRVYGHPTGIYSPQQLAEMSEEEICDAIQKDLAFDTWEWQKQQGMIEYKGRKPLAEGLEKALYVCPECKQIGGMSTEGNTISCRCGYSTKYTATGFFDPPEPFASVAEWYKWGDSELERVIKQSMAVGGELFSDNAARLYLVEQDHNESEKASGRLCFKSEAGKMLLCVGDQSLDIADISRMTMILSNRLVLTCGEDYYEIRTEGVNLRKYVIAWKKIKSLEVN